VLEITFMSRNLPLVLWLCVLFAALSEAEILPAGPRGVVLDQAGASIPRASVTLRYADTTLTIQSDESGHFSFSRPLLQQGVLVISAPHFQTVEISVDSDASSREIQVVLKPAGADERVIVSATRSDLPLS